MALKTPDPKMQKKWEEQEYPKHLRRHPRDKAYVIVQDTHEEQAQLAAWNSDATSAGSTDPAFPKWMFHASEKPRMVKTSDEEHALGLGWFDTIGAAVEDASKTHKLTPAIKQLGDSDPSKPSAGAGAADGATETGHGAAPATTPVQTAGSGTKPAQKPSR